MDDGGTRRRERLGRTAKSRAKFYVNAFKIRGILDKKRAVEQPRRRLEKESRD